MATNLPLLHKYVMNRDDDMQLKMTKLRYRLCVREVSDVILARQSGLDLSTLQLQPPVPIEEETMAAVESQSVFAQPPPQYDPEEDVLSSPDSDHPPSHHPGKGHNPLINDSGLGLDDSNLSNLQDEDHPEDEIVVNGNVPHTEGAMPVTCTLTQDENGDMIVDTGGSNLDDTGMADEDEDLESEPDEDMMNGYHPHQTDDEEEEEEAGEGGEAERAAAVNDSAAAPVSITTTAAAPEPEVEVEESPVHATLAEHANPNLAAETNAEDQQREQQQQQQQPIPEITLTTEDVTTTSTTTTTVTSEESETPTGEGSDTTTPTAELSREDSPEDSMPTTEEPEPEVDEDEGKTDFIVGTKCDDAWAAIDILKTRYRLSAVLDGSLYPGPWGYDSKTTVKNCIITWSRWNLQDMVREPNDLAHTIQNREAEISGLLETVLANERLRKAAEPKKEPTPPSEEATPPSEDGATPTSGDAPAAKPEEEVIECKEEPALATIPEGDPEALVDDKNPKKKKKNIFSRMMRALRKRLSTRGQA